MLLFDEQQGVTLTSTLNVAPPSLTNAVAAATITLPIGSVLNSYIAHADKIGTGTPATRYQGSFTFDNDVVGFRLTASALNGTNTLLGLAGSGDITYDTTGQGLEATGQGIPDRVWVDSDLRTVHFDVNLTNGADEVRILTGSTPPFCTTSDPNQIVTGTPWAVLPADLRLGKTESNSCLLMFDEQEDVTLTSPLNVAPPSLTNAVGAPTVVLATGSVLSSHIVHADRIGSSSVGVRFQGSVTFLEDDVVGFEVTSAGLNATNSLFGLTGAGGITYDPVGRGLEIAGQGNPDRVWLDADLRTVHFDFTNTTGADEVRVLTGTQPPYCENFTLNPIETPTPPADLRLGKTESNTCLLLLDEQQGVTLASSLNAAPPSLTDAVAAPTITLPAGSVVNSYIAHADKIGASAVVKRFQASYTFDNDVVGFQLTASGLNATNALLGIGGVGGITYDSTGQGLEASGQPTPDRVWVDADLRTVHFDVSVTSGADEVRILTGSVPPFCATSDPNRITTATPWTTLPKDLRLGKTESDSCLVLFSEQQSVTLASPLSAAPPSSTNAVGAPTITLPAGSVLTSYIVHADRIGSSSAAKRYQGSRVFSGDVLGFEVTASGLNATNGLFGLTAPGGLTYDTAGQGLELSGQPNPDRVWVDGDRRTVHFDVSNTSGADEIRVLAGPASTSVGGIAVQPDLTALADVTSDASGNAGRPRRVLEMAAVALALLGVGGLVYANGRRRASS